MEFTPSYLANLLNLYNSGESKASLALASLLHESTGANLTANDDDIFQILICQPPYPPYRSVKESMRVKLVYGSKKNLHERFGVTDIPSLGVSVNRNFSQRYPGQEAMVRFLLICRKISQLLVYTWVDLQEANLTENQKLEINLIRAIFDTYNIRPDAIEFVGKGECGETELTQELCQPNYRGNLSNVIKPSSASYATIRLALLLGGQAYYGNKTDELSKIGASIGFENGIFSTYEMVWKHAFSMSWSAFHSIDQDITQAGLNQNPPATVLTIGYPPRPSEFNVSQERIQSWAFSGLYEGEGDFPFYPPQGTSEWNQGKVEYFVPPFPYLPSSST